MSGPRARALPGDRANWQKWSHIELARNKKTYLANANAAGQDPSNPDEMWLAQLIARVRADQGRGAARRFARNIGYCLADMGGPPLITGKRIRIVLNADDNLDPLSINLDSADVPFALGRAQAFADEAYTAEYYRHCRKRAERWVARCDLAGVDPKHPPLELVKTWLAEIAVDLSASSVRAARSAISHYFRANHVPDVARTLEVERVLEGIDREKPREPTRPCSAEERRRILATLERQGAGVRDRVAILLTAFSQWGCEQMVLLDVENCNIDAMGAHVRSPISPETLHIHRHEVEDLNLAFWLEKLTEELRSGPLFRPVARRAMCFSETRMSPQSFVEIIHRAAKRAGVQSKNISEALRNLYTGEKLSGASATVVAHYDGRKTPLQERSEARRAAKIAARRKGYGALR
jgi:integrase